MSTGQTHFGPQQVDASFSTQENTLTGKLATAVSAGRRQVVCFLRHCHLVRRRILVEKPGLHPFDSYPDYIREGLANSQRKEEVTFLQMECSLTDANY